MAKYVSLVSIDGDEMISHWLPSPINHSSCSRLIHPSHDSSSRFNVSLDLSKGHVARRLICSYFSFNRLIENNSASTNGSIACVGRCICAAAGKLITGFFIASRFFPARRFEVFQLDGNSPEPCPLRLERQARLERGLDRARGMSY